LDAAARRVLATEIGGGEQYQEQLYTTSQGTAGHWTVTIAYLALAPASGESPPVVSGRWFDVSRLPKLDMVDANIVAYALLRLRAKLGYTTIAFHLLPERFSLSELQRIYESILNRKLDKRNFRRRLQAEEFLEPTGETRRDGSHRPARLYRFRAAHDAGTYLTPAWATRPELEPGAG
jgi:8-oxo-dGTP diphosphatase